MMDERNYGIDIFRILCCIGVLVYHTVDDVLGSAGADFFYWGASFCVPGFFLLSGYLVARKNIFSIEYYEEKIKVTTYKLFGWIVFWCAVYFISFSQMVDIWGNFLSSAESKGVLPVAWFLFSYMFLMLCAYPLLYIKKKSIWAFRVLVVVYMCILCLGVGKNIVNSKPQALWLHLYGGYFTLGMVLSDIKYETKKMKYRLLSVCSIVFILCALYYSTCYSAGIPDRHYGKWYYSLWLVAMFIICSMINVKGKNVRRLLKSISDNTFVVYLGHLPILLYITAIKPLQNIFDALLMIIILFVITNIMAEVFRRLPLLRKIV